VKRLAIFQYIMRDEKKEALLDIPLVPPSKGETCCFSSSQLFSSYATPFFFAFSAPFAVKNIITVNALWIPPAERDGNDNGEEIEYLTILHF
jgi:hypothetical protein